MTPEITIRHLNFSLIQFERRFGWSEMGGGMEGKEILSKLSSEDKFEINTAIDTLLKWMCSCAPVTEVFVSAMQHIVTQTKNPVVRQQTHRFLYNWLLTQLKQDSETAVEAIRVHFGVIQQVFVTGLTDVWSAVRKITSKKFVRICPLLNPIQIDRLFNEFQSKCLSPSTSWQAKEGSLLGLTGLLRCFEIRNLRMTPDAPRTPTAVSKVPGNYTNGKKNPFLLPIKNEKREGEENADGKKPVVINTLGLNRTKSEETAESAGNNADDTKSRHSPHLVRPGTPATPRENARLTPTIMLRKPTKKLPQRMADALPDLLYKMLAHPQLTIRRCAKKAFITLLSRCPFTLVASHIETLIQMLRCEYSVPAPSTSPPSQLNFTPSRNSPAAHTGRKAESARERKGHPPLPTRGRHTEGGASGSATTAAAQAGGKAVGRGSREQKHEMNLHTNSSVGSTPAALGSEMTIENPFEAEGILSLWHALVCLLPEAFVLARWHTLYQAFERYLGHHASTVRQVASSLVVEEEAALGIVWETIEGRLLALELLLEFLLANHAMAMSRPARARLSPLSHPYQVSSKLAVEKVTGSTGKWTPGKPGIIVINSSNRRAGSNGSKAAGTASTSVSSTKKRRKTFNWEAARELDERGGAGSAEAALGASCGATSAPALLKHAAGIGGDGGSESSANNTPKSNAETPEEKTPHTQKDNNLHDKAAAAIGRADSSSSSSQCSPQGSPGLVNSPRFFTPRAFYRQESVPVLVSSQRSSATGREGARLPTSSSHDSSSSNNNNSANTIEQPTELRSHGKWRGRLRINPQQSPNETQKRASTPPAFGLASDETASVLEYLAAGDRHFKALRGEGEGDTDRNGGRGINNYGTSSSSSSSSPFCHMGLAGDLNSSKVDSMLLRQQPGSLGIERFGVVLAHVLKQATAATFHLRWELRRMADQVLPLTIQALMVFDLGVLEKLWRSAFAPSAPAFHHCIASLSLKYALRTILEFQRSGVKPASHVPGTPGIPGGGIGRSSSSNAEHLAAPTSSTRGGDSSACLLRKRAIAGLVTRFHSAIPQAIEACLQLFFFEQLSEQRDSTAQDGEHDGYHLSQRRQQRQRERLRQGKSVSRRLETLAVEILVIALSAFGMRLPAKTRRRAFSAVTFHLMDVGKRRHTNGQRVERWLVSCVHGFLEGFCQRLSFFEMLQLAPVLLGYLERHDEQDIQLDLLKSLAHIFSRPTLILSFHKSQHSGVIKSNDKNSRDDGIGQGKMGGKAMPPPSSSSPCIFASSAASAQKGSKSMKDAAGDAPHSKQGKDEECGEEGESKLEAVCARAVPIVLRLFSKTEQVENVKNPCIICYFPVGAGYLQMFARSKAPSTPPRNGRAIWQTRNLNVTIPLHHQSNDIREGLLTPARGGSERTPPSEGYEIVGSPTAGRSSPQSSRGGLAFDSKGNVIKTRYHSTGVMIRRELSLAAAAVEVSPTMRSREEDGAEKGNR
eukprot:jgi/Bigna1/134505/aug1.25_g9213